MKLSLNWLREYVNVDASAEEIAEKLTMSGFEVEEIIHGENFSGVVVGKVVSIEKHPNADKLRVAKVDVGNDILQIVCGAANLEEGQTVPVAIVGAKLGDFEISKASLRGVDSFGMICSEKELGLGDDHSGIMILEHGHKIGEVFTSDKTSDTILDVKVLANRPDCMGVIGLSREVATLFGKKFVLPKINVKTTKQKIDLNIRVENYKLCPRYMAKLITNVEDGESPKWLKERLMSCGVRPLGILVDISNYVMLEYGQPLHFFDFDKLTSNNADLIVRNAVNGEKIVTLDNVERKLDENNLVIANSEKPIAIAGVMGGLDTEIDKNTRNILIEAAVFDKASIRRTSRKLGLRSEAVARFEKGLSQSLPEFAIERAAQLLYEIANGQVSDMTIDFYSKKDTKQKITVSTSKLNEFLGTKIDQRDIINTLNLLDFVTKAVGDKCEINVPWWRVDIVEPVDIYEEVIRIIGYDKVPYTLPFGVELVPNSNKKLEFVTKVRNKLATLGFYDTLTYSFVALKDLEALGYNKDDLYEIANPMVKDIAHLRPTLIVSILESLKHNQFLKNSVRLFEIGKTFKKNSKGKLPIETTELVIGVVGGETWPINQTEAREYYDIKGVLESVFGTDILLDFIPANLPYLAAGRQATIYVGKEEIGYIGEVSASISKKFGIERPAAVAVIDVEKVLAQMPDLTTFREFSKYQYTNRDLSVLISETTEVKNIQNAVLNSSDIIKNVEVVDIYRDKQLGANTKSVSIRMFIQSDTKTLTENEIDSAFEAAIKAVTKIGGKIRGVKE